MWKYKAIVTNTANVRQHATFKSVMQHCLSLHQTGSQVSFDLVDDLIERERESE